MLTKTFPRAYKKLTQSFVYILCVWFSVCVRECGADDLTQYECLIKTRKKTTSLYFNHTINQLKRIGVMIIINVLPKSLCISLQATIYLLFDYNYFHLYFLQFFWASLQKFHVLFRERSALFRSRYFGQEIFFYCDVIIRALEHNNKMFLIGNNRKITI